MRLRFGDGFQLTLIGLGVVATALFGVFFYREVFPEYKEYQKRFVALEEFRSTYTGERPAPFEMGIKQLVFEKEDKGPADVERCISCHVALQIPAYNPKDPENYVWGKLNQRIQELRSNGKTSEAEQLEGLKTVEVGDFVYDVTKVLTMHPLMEGESRPFEFHPMTEFGCVACHNGNGKGLVTDRAHGPVFDGAYEAEEMGYKPEFLEKDIDNDPTIAKVFNEKPGHRLLFQTSPIYVGALIQAKCVNCHEAAPARQSVDEVAEAHRSDIEKMLQDYTRGEELFISQACYACHKIAGFSRGGVGPELTKEGESYPWFVKESIVWPQADLKTSTMPNYRLDHFEIEDLLTFLLGQTGESRVLSGTAYRNKIAAWEAGKKLTWEKSVPPAEIKDVNYGLKVFATEGCAACHRLRGYTSEVQLAEKGDKKWFQELIGEQILGSDLARVIQENKDQLEAKIKVEKEEPGLLDELDKAYPELLASFYPAFRFAERKSDDKAYQALLRQVLMLFIQEYGLGRQIGPKPNWSGVYRSDKWLINHFKNPQAEIPRSIMPVFPFDETKFFALTYMLDVMGQKNRDAFRKRWEPSGFDPAAAYQELCSQCHGENLVGNGPVSEWIYPIPKNLRKAEFLRNLTRERVKASLVHGIKGTPMPPWGEVGKGKEGPPVLNEQEIELLVDWLFSFLSGSEVIREEDDLPKWQYTPEDVVEELKKEGAEFSSALSKFKNFYAAFNPAGIDEPPKKVSDIFDVVPAEDQYPEENRYYIKKKYYTPENIAQGEALFWENCASCHGKEADGAGLRAEAMYDAKPRMLTNLNWLESRDDLRLLRSIKYGVTGTSMQPWGDMTSSKQRLQMVIYIRHLSEESRERGRLMDLVYDVFDKEYVELTLSEAKVSKALQDAEKSLKTNKRLFEKTETKETFEAYLEAKQIAEELEKKDQKYQTLKDNLKVQKEALSAIGFSALSFPGEISDKAIDLIKARGDTLKATPDGLEFTFDLERRKRFMAVKRKLSESIDLKMEAFQKEEKILAGKVPTLEVKDQLSSLKAKKQVLETFKNKVQDELKTFYKKLNEEKRLTEEIRAK